MAYSNSHSNEHGYIWQYICHKSHDIIRLSWIFRSPVHRQTKMKQGIIYQKTVSTGKGTSTNESSKIPIVSGNIARLIYPSQVIIYYQDKLSLCTAEHWNSLPREEVVNRQEISRFQDSAEEKHKLIWQPCSEQEARLDDLQNSFLINPSLVLKHIHLKRLTWKHILQKISCMDKMYQLTDLGENTVAMKHLKEDE